MNIQNPSEKMIRVWDPLVRIFHWALVVAFFTAYISEDDFLDLHVYAGYTVLGLITFRLIWGFIGTRHARFSSFVTRPEVAIQYLKDSLAMRAKRYIGHNPAGAAMIVLLILSLFMTTLTGIATYGAVESLGPLSSLGTIGEFGEEALEELHEFFANFTLLLVFIHIGGVIVESLIHKENLARAMVHGKKRAEPEENPNQE